MTWYAGNNSTNGGNNTGWVFTAPSGGVNYSLTCSVGTYSYTGQTATFTYVAGQINYSLTCSVGSYAVIGQDATLTYVNKNQIIYGGAGTYKGNLKEEIKKDDEEDDEEMIIMALAHQLIEMRVI